jgi:deoxyribodipyrimidine photolyase-related protein
VTVRTLALVLGDQLSPDNPAVAALDPARDAVLMIEAPGEATHVWNHKARITLFLAAMRHHRDALRARGFTVHYVALGDSAANTLPERLAEQLAALAPASVRMIEAGEYRLEQEIAAVCARVGVPLETLPDPHFYCSRADFAACAAKYKHGWRMELFYREMRKRHRVLLTPTGEPVGGAWNFDAENRKAYGKQGPGLVPDPAFFTPCALTRDVLAEVEARFPDHPGSLAHFAWPVTRAQALVALDQFITHRLPNFGDYQDAMWAGAPFGWHSLLAPALNLHLLDPREVVAAAEQAYTSGHAPSPAWKGSSARSSAGASSSAASTGSRCRRWRLPTSWRRGARCRASIGQATPTWPASVTRSAPRSHTATPTTSSA